jgi:hypothetical protein
MSSGRGLFDWHCNACRVQLVINKTNYDRLYGLVVRVPGYRFKGPGAIPSATRISEKQCVWDGVYSAS